MYQQVLTEVVELCDGFTATGRKKILFKVKPTNGFDVGFDHRFVYGFNTFFIRVERGGYRRGFLPFFPIVFIVIPLASKRFVLVHQQVIFFAHIAIKILHDELLFALKKLFQFIPFGKKVLGVITGCRNPDLLAKQMQFPIQSMLIGEEVFEFRYIFLFDQNF